MGYLFVPPWHHLPLPHVMAQCTFQCPTTYPTNGHLTHLTLPILKTLQMQSLSFESFFVHHSLKTLQDASFELCPHGIAQLISWKWICRSFSLLPLKKKIRVNARAATSHPARELDTGALDEEIRQEGKKERRNGRHS